MHAARLSDLSVTPGTVWWNEANSSQKLSSDPCMPALHTLLNCVQLYVIVKRREIRVGWCCSWCTSVSRVPASKA